MKTITLRLDDALHKAIVKEAKFDKRSVNSWLTFRIEEAVNRAFAERAMEEESKYDKNGVYIEAPGITYESTEEPRDLGEVLRDQGDEPGQGHGSQEPRVEPL